MTSADAAGIPSWRTERHPHHCIASRWAAEGCVTFSSWIRPPAAHRTGGLGEQQTDGPQTGVGLGNAYTVPRRSPDRSSESVAASGSSFAPALISSSESRRVASPEPAPERTSPEADSAGVRATGVDVAPEVLVSSDLLLEPATAAAVAAAAAPPPAATALPDSPALPESPRDSAASSTPGVPIRPLSIEPRQAPVA